jgi:hypothetical protein
VRIQHIGLADPAVGAGTHPRGFGGLVAGCAWHPDGASRYVSHDRGAARLAPTLPASPRPATPIRTVFKARNAVRVPPRAQQSPSSEGVFALTRVQSLWSGPSDAGSRPWPGRRGGLFGCVGGGFRVRAGRSSAWWNLGLCVVLSAVSGGQLLVVTHSSSGVVVTT